MNQGELKKIYSYDPESGFFTRISDKKICTLTNAGGYVVLTIKNKKYYAHRLAFLFMNGETPKEVDHKDGNRSNNSWKNLRSVERKQNCENRAPSGGLSKFKGVTKNGTSKLWRAKIKHNRKTIHLGYFKSEIQAAHAYNQAANKLFGEYARPNL